MAKTFEELNTEIRVDDGGYKLVPALTVTVSSDNPTGRNALVFVANPDRRAAGEFVRMNHDDAKMEMFMRLMERGYTMSSWVDEGAADEAKTARAVAYVIRPLDA